MVWLFQNASPGCYGYCLVTYLHSVVPLLLPLLIIVTHQDRGQDIVYDELPSPVDVGLVLQYSVL
jgi:hypothetical protein